MQAYAHHVLSLSSFSAFLHFCSARRGSTRVACAFAEGDAGVLRAHQTRPQERRIGAAKLRQYRSVLLERRYAHESKRPLRRHALGAIAHDNLLRRHAKNSTRHGGLLLPYPCGIE